MKLLGSTERQITKHEIGENVPPLEIAEVVLIHCNVVNNHYLYDLRVLGTFVPNKSFGQLLNIVPSDETKNMLQNYKQIWSRLKNVEKYMKIKFNSDNGLSLKKKKLKLTAWLKKS